MFVCQVYVNVIKTTVYLRGEKIHIGHYLDLKGFYKVYFDLRGFYKLAFKCGAIYISE